MFRVVRTPQFDTWLKGLKDAMVRQRLVRRLDQVVLGNLGDHKSAGEGLMELRADFGPGWRLYYVQRGAVLILVPGRRREVVAAPRHSRRPGARRHLRHSRGPCPVTATPPATIDPRTLPDFDPAHYLNSPEDIAAYLTVVAEENDPAALAQALGTVARARGMASIAEAAGLQRESLYKALGQGASQPLFDTIRRVCGALGVAISFTPAPGAVAAPVRPRRRRGRPGVTGLA